MNGAATDNRVCVFLRTEVSTDVGCMCRSGLAGSYVSTCSAWVGFAKQGPKAAALTDTHPQCVCSRGSRLSPTRGIICLSNTFYFSHSVEGTW